MAKTNIYKPRYFFANRTRSKINIYKDGHLRRFFERRGRRVKRGGLFRRYVLVAANRKWTKARRFIRPMRRWIGRSIGRSRTGFSYFGRPFKRKYIFSFFEKQRIRYFYGKRKESSFRAVFNGYRNIQGITSNSFFAKLESRLDRSLYRRRLFPTLYGCRQFVHYHGVLINDTIEKSPRYQIEVGDSLAISNFAWRSVYWDLFCRVYYRRWGRHIIARRFYSRFKKKIFKFRWFTFHRSPRTRNMQKKHWFNFGSPFSRAKDYKLFQKRKPNFKRSRKKRFYVWKWLNRIAFAKKHKKTIYNPFRFSKTNKRGHLLFRLFQKKAGKYKRHRSNKKNSDIKKTKQQSGFSRSKNFSKQLKLQDNSAITKKKKKNTRIFNSSRPVGRRITRRDFCVLSKPFILNNFSIRYKEPKPDAKTMYEDFSGFHHLSPKIYYRYAYHYDKVVQSFLERNRINDKFDFSSQIQYFMDQRHTDAVTIAFEKKKREELREKYSFRKIAHFRRKINKLTSFILNQKVRKKFLPRLKKKKKKVKKVGINRDSNHRVQEETKATTTKKAQAIHSIKNSINPIIKKRLKKSKPFKTIKLKKKRIFKKKTKKGIKAFSKSKIRGRKKYSRFRRFWFRKQQRSLGYIRYLRRKIARFFRRMRYRIRRRQGFPRLNSAHRYFPSYFQVDLRTLRTIKISTPNSNNIYSGFKLSPAKIYSFYKSRGYLFWFYFF